MEEEGQEEPLESQGSVKFEETPFNNAVAAEKSTKLGEHPNKSLVAHNERQRFYLPCWQ